MKVGVPKVPPKYVETHDYKQYENEKIPAWERDSNPQPSDRLYSEILIDFTQNFFWVK